MADEGYDKQYEPTAHRRRQAREAGIVLFCPELAWAFALMSGALFLRITRAGINPAARALCTYLEKLHGQTAPAELWAGSRELLRTSVGIALPFLLIILLVVLFAGLVQTGFLFHWPKAAIGGGQKLSRRRLFPGGWWARLGTGFLKVGFAILVAWLVLGAWWTRIAFGITQCPASAADTALSVLTELALKTGAGLLALTVIDYLYERHLYYKQLRLTRVEYREELRLEEGEPLARQRRTQRARELLQRQQTRPEKAQ